MDKTEYIPQWAPYPFCSQKGRDALDVYQFQDAKEANKN